jgi:hypothetical protein
MVCLKGMPTSEQRKELLELHKTNIEGQMRCEITQEVLLQHLLGLFFSLACVHIVIHSIHV